MGLLILIVVGAVLGWLATIVLRIEDGRGIAIQALVGILGSLVVGLIAGEGTFIGSLTGMALLFAVLGAVVSIALFNLVKPRAYR